MTRVTGIGGVFFTAQDPASQIDWYRRHLGIDVQDGFSAMFPWREQDDPDKEGMTVWSIFPRDTPYFRGSGSSFMINYRVQNLEATLTELRAAGVQVDERVEEYEYGKFGWATDPEGNRIELWES